jgi:hypothetical protein
VSLFQKYRLTKFHIGLLLVAAIAVNAGFQYTAQNLNPLAMDVCEHTDSESECDKEEKVKTDDVISHNHKNITFLAVNPDISHYIIRLDYSDSHPEIFTPPPEYFF